MSIEKGKWLKWFSELNMCSLSLSTLLLSIILLIISAYDPYLQNSFNNNVKKNLISSLRFTKENCSLSEEVANLGTWTGIDEVCYCYDKTTKYPKVYDRGCASVQNNNPNITCNSFSPKLGPIKLTKYKGYKICFERSHFNYQKLLNSIKNQISLNTIPISDSIVLDNVINKEGINLITDIKLINMNMLSAYERDNLNLTSYSKAQELDNNYTLYLQKKNFKDAKNIERFIVDVNLFNQVLCPFLDLAPPPSHALSSNFIDFGYVSCNNYFKDNEYNYIDLNRRFEKINLKEDTFASKNDFYSDVNNNTIVDTYNKILSNNSIYKKYFDGNIKGRIEPVLTYEKLWPGLYCNKFMDPEEILGKYDNLHVIRGLSISIFVFEIIMFIFLACRKLAKTLEVDNYLFWSEIILFIVILSQFLMSLFLCILGKSSWGFFYNFHSECQLDNSNININSNKVSPLEDELMYNISYLTSFGLAITTFYCLLLIYVMFFILSKLDCTSLQDGAGDTRKRKSELSNLPF